MTAVNSSFSNEFFTDNQQIWKFYANTQKRFISTFGVRNNRFVLITTDKPLLQRIWNAFLRFIGVIKTDVQSILLLQEFVFSIPSLNAKVAATQKLQEQLTQAQSDNRELNRTIEELQSNIEMQNKNLRYSEELQEEISKLNENVEEATAKLGLIDEYEEKKAVLGKLDQFEEQIADLTIENEEYKQKIAELEGSVAALKDNGANNIARNLPHLVRNAQLLEIFLQSMNRKPKEAGKPTLMRETLAEMRSNKKYNEEFNSLVDYLNKLGPTKQ